MLSEFYSEIISYENNTILYEKMKASKFYQLACKQVVKFREVDVTQLQKSQYKSFFINLHNFMYFHSCSKFIPIDFHSRRYTLLNDWYIFGHYKLSMYDIETYILRGREPEPDKYYLKQFQLDKFDNRINFALINGGKYQ
jgi:hypothetical protein